MNRLDAKQVDSERALMRTHHTRVARLLHAILARVVICVALASSHTAWGSGDHASQAAERLKLRLADGKYLTIERLSETDPQRMNGFALRFSFPNGKAHYIPFDEPETAIGSLTSLAALRVHAGEQFLWLPWDDLGSRNPQMMTYHIVPESGHAAPDRTWVNPKIDPKTACVHEYSQAGHAGAIAKRTLTCRVNGTWKTQFTRSQTVGREQQDDDCRVIYIVSQHDQLATRQRRVRFTTCDPMTDRFPVWVQRSWDRSVAP